MSVRQTDSQQFLVSLNMIQVQISQQDVYAYRTVGIPISRIFTINSRGELRHELTQTFQTS